MYKMLRCVCVFMLAVFAVVSNGQTSIQASEETLEEISAHPSVFLNVSTSDATPVTTAAAAATVTISTTTTAEPTTNAETNTTAEPTTTVGTTTPSASTTIAPTPTKSPPGEPIVGTWNVTEGNKTCLRISMAVQFKVNETVYNLPNDSSSSKSKCGDNSTEATLVLDFEKSSFILKFDMDKDLSLKKLAVVLKESDITVESEKNVSLFKIEKGYNEYVCISRDHVPLDKEVSVYFEKVEVEYHPSDKPKGYSCDLDRTSDAVPIAVGCALAGLVIIVLIAYLVGRRRSRQRGYQSV